MAPEADEDTKIRCACPFCSGTYTVRGSGKIEHASPACERWAHLDPDEFLRQARAIEAQRAAGAAAIPARPSR